MAWVDINELVKEMLAIKANNEELTKRVMVLEQEVEKLAREKKYYRQGW